MSSAPADRGAILVTGAAGMLGSQLVLDAPAGTRVLATDLRAGDGVDVAEVDLADEASVERLFEEHGPIGGVLHAAAFTAVDLAEEQEPLARTVNALVPGVLGAACARRGVRLVAVGTDFVFDGESERPYREDDPPRPLSAYGRTKLAGERAALDAHPEGTSIVRTQWLYGPRGNHFPRTIVGHARRLGQLKVVDDQIGAPTSTLELSPALWHVLEHGEAGVYHAACGGSCSWFGFTRAILEECGLGEVELTPCTTADFPRPAHRPAYSVLDSTRLEQLRGRPLADWRVALHDYLATEAL